MTLGRCFYRDGSTKPCLHFPISLQHIKLFLKIAFSSSSRANRVYWISVEVLLGFTTNLDKASYTSAHNLHSCLYPYSWRWWCIPEHMFELTGSKNRTIIWPTFILLNQRPFLSGCITLWFLIDKVMSLWRRNLQQVLLLFERMWER